jgi:hypothetical protein
MTRQEWTAIYEEAWGLYYSKEHMRTLLRRTAATGAKLSSMVKLLVTFSLSNRLENVHPIQVGILRRRHPSERRPGLAPEPALLFWPRLAWETTRKTCAILSSFAWLTKEAIKAARASDRYSYVDQALTPVHDDDDETLDLMTKTSGARAAVAHIKRVDELTHAFAAKPVVGQQRTA